MLDICLDPVLAPISHSSRPCADHCEGPWCWDALFQNWTPKPRPFPFLLRWGCLVSADLAEGVRLNRGWYSFQTSMDLWSIEANLIRLTTKMQVHNSRPVKHDWPTISMYSFLPPRAMNGKCMINWNGWKIIHRNKWKTVQQKGEVEVKCRVSIPLSQIFLQEGKSEQKKC